MASLGQEFPDPFIPPSARFARGSVTHAAREARLALDPTSAVAEPADVALIADEIAAQMGLEPTTREEVRAAATLHDVGKSVLPQALLERRGPLKATERALVQRHPLYAESLIEKTGTPGLDRVAVAVRHTQEHYDGNGYPDGLAGDEIPLPSRIVHCAQAYQAIRCDRPYREGRSARRALQEVAAGSGTQFDPEVVFALARARSALRLRPARALAGNHRRLAVLLLCLTMAGGASAYAFDAPVRDWAASVRPFGVGLDRAPQSHATAPSDARATAPAPAPRRRTVPRAGAGNTTAARPSQRRAVGGQSTESAPPRDPKRTTPLTPARPDAEHVKQMAQGLQRLAALRRTANAELLRSIERSAEQPGPEGHRRRVLLMLAALRHLARTPGADDASTRGRRATMALILERLRRELGVPATTPGQDGASPPDAATTRARRQ